MAHRPAVRRRSPVVSHVLSGFGLIPIAIGIGIDFTIDPGDFDTDSDSDPDEPPHIENCCTINQYP
jgi:hypothetical protein